MQEKTPAQLRAAAEERLRAPGAERLRLVQQRDEVDEELRPLVVAAKRAGITYRRLHEVSGVPPITVGRWARRTEPDAGVTYDEGQLQELGRKAGRISCAGSRSRRTACGPLVADAIRNEVPVRKITAAYGDLPDHLPGVVAEGEVIMVSRARARTHA
ncbi:hypothetical protein [Streptomyces nigra]|uniref:hypothetical protein n=1 Tax=Streptomyces nigra TaxID=1827580 RepID=UPI0030CEBF6A